jgi:hypothetical protein
MRYGFGVILAALLTAGPALAHHSLAMYDREKLVSLTGTVRQFRFSNPHIGLQIMAQAETGAPAVLWRIEGGNPERLARQGWKRDVFKRGDKITVTINPLRSGEAEGLFVSAVTARGDFIGRAPPAPAAD